MTQDSAIYPAYARSERIADGTLHVLGVSGALIGAGVLLQMVLGQSQPALGFALLIYALTLIATFAASACYHMTPMEHLRPMFRRFDHAAIYLKIAGTYTPLVVMVGGALAYGVLAIVWSLAAFGVIKNLFFWRTPGRWGPVVPLVMGWLSLFLIWRMVAVYPDLGIWCVVIGGLIYSLGVIFYKWEALKFSNAIWHLFVLTASACFFAAIYLGARVYG